MINQIKIYRALIGIAVVSLISFSGFSQVILSKEKAAERAFENYDYPTAIHLYELMETASIDALRKKALSYWYTNNPQAADTVFAELLSTDSYIKEDAFNYAMVLQELGRYDDAEKWIKKFTELDPYDTRAQLYKKRPKAFKYLQKENSNFKIKHLSINSEEQDFSPVFYKDKVVFSSSRHEMEPIMRRWNANELPFLDLFIADRDSGVNLTNLSPFNDKENKKFHEGPVTFYNNGKSMVFTRNNYQTKNSDGKVTLQLFSSEWVNEAWTTPKSLPFNDPEFSFAHATVSIDGKTMYFASNMAGGMGGIDLYRVEINPDGSFGKPINLGPTINTEGDESFPFIHPGNEMLFFASNGHVGLGGLDVFMAHVRKNQSVSKVINLGAPVNSAGDDFSFILDSAQTMGYFASNRTGGKGSDDIYGFNLTKPFVMGKVIKGTVKDESGAPLANTEITLFNLLSGETEIIITANDGTFEFVVESENTFNLRGFKPKFLVESRTVDSHTKDEIINANLVLTKDSGLMLSTLVKDKNTNRPLQNAKLTIIDNDTKKTIEVMTPPTGLFEMHIKGKQLKDKGNYTIKIAKDGYISKTLEYKPTFNRLGKYEVHKELDMSMDPLKVGGDLSKLIDIKPIFFDVGKDDIRPDAAIELNKIVKVMNENPTMVIELGSHTDARGSAAANASLSDARAKASAAYIAARISNPGRITGKGYGESKPNTVILQSDNGDEKKILTEDFINTYREENPELFDKLHQMNRRTEFIIIRM